MARPISVDIVRHVSDEKLNTMIRTARKEMSAHSGSKKVYDRLLFVKMRYSGRTVEEAAEIVGVSRATGYNMQELWNTHGPKHLFPAPNPGRPSRMTEDQKDHLRNVLASHPMDTNGVRMYIHEEFGIEYSTKQVYVILSKMGLQHAKPFFERHGPEEAEERHKTNLRMFWTSVKEDV